MLNKIISQIDEEAPITQNHDELSQTSDDEVVTHHLQETCSAKTCGRTVSECAYSLNNPQAATHSTEKGANDTEIGA